MQLAKNTAHVLGPEAALDYFNAQSVMLGRNIAPLEVWNMVLAQPAPLLKLAFRIRDQISTRFGVKAIGGFSGKPVAQVAVGEYLDFFLVEHVDDGELVLTERDRHLDVMTSIMTRGPVVTITSSVLIHNWFGRAYMLPVGVAHRLIVHRMLKRLVKAV